MKELSVSQKDALHHNFYSNKSIEINFSFKVLKDTIGLRVGFDFINTSDATVIFRSFHDDNSSDMNTFIAGEYNFTALIPANILKNGSFGIKPAIGIHNVRWIIHSDNLVIPLTITNVEGLNSAFADNRPGVIMPQLSWEKQTDK
ncbi:hypothetical protein [Flavobacterium sp. 3HN19-14]|uniref:hypothetical protein n=1 Tax=Flavobacterium sp. 3HN19-14 TaxID=3448133 RepID=UPI003EDF2316